MPDCCSRVQRADVSCRSLLTRRDRASSDHVSMASSAGYYHHCSGLCAHILLTCWTLIISRCVISYQFPGLDRLHSSCSWLIVELLWHVSLTSCEPFYREVKYDTLGTKSYLSFLWDASVNSPNSLMQNFVGGLEKTHWIFRLMDVSWHMPVVLCNTYKKAVYQPFSSQTCVSRLLPWSGVHISYVAMCCC